MGEGTTHDQKEESSHHAAAETARDLNRVRVSVELPEAVTKGVESIPGLVRAVRAQNETLVQVLDAVRRLTLDPVFLDVAQLLDSVETARQHFVAAYAHRGRAGKNRLRVDFEAYLSGFALEIRNLLKRHGVEPTGEENVPFDPDLHRIVEVITDNGDEGIVREVRRQGYKFERRILRYAEVVITKRSTGSQGKGGE
jgi:molecular chaperone GrpE (heat shock protein)